MPKQKIKHQNRIRIKKIHHDLVNFPYLNIRALYRNIDIAHLWGGGGGGGFRLSYLGCLFD